MPSISLLEAKQKRLQHEIESLEKKYSNSLKAEADALKKINAATSAISRTKNVNTMKTKKSEIVRENQKVMKAKTEQGKYTVTISKKRSEISNTAIELSKESIKIQKQFQNKQEQKISSLNDSQVFAGLSISQQTNGLEKEYDIFISHAAEDKKDFVEELVSTLDQNNIRVWYDSTSIAWGSSIRQAIDKGLRNSKYGIVIISPNFINKHWTQYELDGILNKESATGQQIILPIWHNVTADEVNAFSYSLSNRLALNSAINTIEDIVDRVRKILA